MRNGCVQNYYTIAFFKFLLNIRFVSNLNLATLSYQTRTSAVLINVIKRDVRSLVYVSDWIDYIWLSLYAAYQIAFLILPIKTLHESQLPPGSSVVIVCEQVSAGC